MKYSGWIILFICLSINAFGQNERKFVREGNQIFMDAVKDTLRLDTAKFAKAETEYRKALEKRPDDLKWNFNLADALYKQMKLEESENSFEDIGSKTEDPIEKARAYHNKGNSLLFQQKIDDSIEAFKTALRNNPNDLETKYNLAYAQMLKNQQQNQQQQQQQNQENQQNQEDNNENQQNQNNQQNQQDQQNQQQQQNQENQENQQQQNKISRENAEQLLQALQNDERDIQEKVKEEQAAQARRVIVEKDW